MEWIVARWVTFVATLLVTGACAVGLALVPRVNGDAATRHAISRDAARWGIGAILALIPASFLRLADQVMALRSPGDPLLQGLNVLLTSTTWGTGFLWQAAATLVAGIGLLAPMRVPLARFAWTLACAGAIGLCVTPSLQGHAIGSEERTMLAVAADVAHVVGASLWLGALGVIAWLGVAPTIGEGVVSAERAARAESRLRALVPLVPPLALPGAALLIGSGVIATVLHVQALSDLWLTDWGRYVTIKAVLVSAIVLLGALNWRRLGPRLATADGVGPLRRSLLIELGLALLVLLVTAVLVVTPLPGE